MLKGISIVHSSGAKNECIVKGWNAHNGKRLKLGIYISDSFPFSKPTVFLENHQDFGWLAHVSLDGTICFIDNDGFVLDYENPAGIITESIQRSLRTLKASLDGNNRDDIFSELEAYFNHFDGARTVNSILPGLDELRLVKSCMISKEFWIGLNRKQLEQFAEKIAPESTNPSTFSKYLYVPLKDSALSKIPVPDLNGFWRLTQIREFIFSNLRESHFSLLRLLKETKHLSIIIKLSLLDGTFVHFGIDFSGHKESKHPLLNGKSCAKPRPININRMDKDYLTSRGGSNSNLSDKRVVVVGCGAVGSIVALELAKAGILHLTLVDHDTLSKDNLYRHALGYNSKLGTSKVDALKKEIEGKLPLTTVCAINGRFETVMQTEQIDFSVIDLVVIATGDPNSSFVTNQFFLEHYPGLPVLYTWLEPFGIGGHTLLTNNKTSAGCFHCLYKRDEIIGLHNQFSFAKEGQAFKKSVSGCATRFTPFSSLDSTRSAIEAVRVSVLVLLGKLEENSLWSWKGDAELFRENGYLTTPRFEHSSELLEAGRKDFVNMQCTVCTLKHQK